jgi:hypothetical protein
MSDVSREVVLSKARQGLVLGQNGGQRAMAQRHRTSGEQ